MSKRVLLVDDDPEATEGLRRLLAAQGYVVQEINDSAKALEAARHFQPHFVILDYNMPAPHGGDVAWQLARDPGLEIIPTVIVWSGKEAAEIRSAMPPVKIAILEKAVDTEALLELLRGNAAV